jgi:tRNA G18 (ribose-2'-O)-methylase SpoU
LSDDAQEYTKIKYDQKTVLVVGSENRGVSKILIDNADFKVKIKMVGKVQSLNVSVATGILLGEITRQYQ